ncbi:MULTISPECIES: lytic transglycosylase domain-containing protein [unclassified Rhodanobacter]|uniref:Lytic transglycosylase domain-containing protein n=1 Tax=Rhodanobacter humi TaxID=1888173 RepID=A0ABV4AVE5_9GAMM
MLDFAMLAQQCAPLVDHRTLAAVVSVESGRNPYAIGVVDGHLVRQPRNLDEAVATAEALEQGGWNFSVGIAQVNKKNLDKNGVSYAQAFDACKNLNLGAQILKDCYQRAQVRFPDQQAALQAAFSCYYSGNFTRGFRPDKAGQPSYVAKVLAQATGTAQPIPVVPAVSGSAQSAPKPAKPPLPPADHSSVMMDTTSKPEDSAALDAEPPDHAPVLFHRAAPPAPEPAVDKAPATPVNDATTAINPTDANVRHVRVY